MPVDDDDDADASVFGQPLPPDDRLWRHPSELRWGKPDLPAPVTRSARPWGLAVAAGTVGAVLAVGVVALVTGFPPRVGDTASDQVAPTTISATNSSTAGVEDIAAGLGDAIARLEVERVDGDVVGSAVFVRDGSYLVTNAHLLDQALVVRLFTADGQERDATVVGTDAATDVAVLKVSVLGKQPAKIGTTTGLRVGQQAIAIGGPPPSGTAPAVWVGVVSALDRRVAAVDGTPLHGMIQTDVPTAPESAGGALVDGDGAVIGITTWITGSDGQGALGVATPIEVAMAVADDIIDTGKAHHVWLGIEGDDLDAETMADLGVKGGAQVHAVIDDSPAAAAGLSPDDVIVGVDDTPVLSISSLVVALRQHDSGEQVTVHYLRDGKAATAIVTLVEK